MSTKKELAVNSDVSQALAAGFPQDLGFTRVLLPRLTMFSQDVFEGKGKSAKLVKEAGMFVKEYQSEEMDENGKNIWAKDELGMEIEATIVFQRKQLKYYDPATEDFTSSTIFDSNDEVVPLFCNKAEVARGNVADLKAKYNYVDPKDGKTKSHLGDNKVLYVLYKGDIYQMSLRGSSMYSCKTYLKGTPNPTTFLTKFSSEAKEKGTIAWNMMTFANVRALTVKEMEAVLEKQTEIRESVDAEKAYFSSIAGTAPTGQIVPQEEVNRLLREGKENQ